MKVRRTEQTRTWLYDADRDDPLTQLRIPVTGMWPERTYLLVFDRGSACRPDEAEARQLTSCLDYLRQAWFPEAERRRMLARPFDVNRWTDHATLVLRKYGSGTWAYRYTHWPEEVPFWPVPPFCEQHIAVTLEQVLDKVREEEDWRRWKGDHPQEFPPDGSVGSDAAGEGR